MTDTKELRAKLAAVKLPLRGIPVFKYGKDTGLVGIVDETDDTVLGFNIELERAALIVAAINALPGLLEEVELLRAYLAIYIHAHATGNSVPPHIDAEARAALKQP